MTLSEPLEILEGIFRSPNEKTFIHETKGPPKNNKEERKKKKQTWQNEQIGKNQYIHFNNWLLMVSIP